MNTLLGSEAFRRQLLERLARFREKGLLKQPGKSPEENDLRGFEESLRQYQHGRIGFAKYLTKELDELLVKLEQQTAPGKSHLSEENFALFSRILDFLLEISPDERNNPQEIMS